MHLAREGTVVGMALLEQVMVECHQRRDLCIDGSRAAQKMRDVPNSSEVIPRPGRIG